jgi:dihydrofolate reductase
LDIWLRGGGDLAGQLAEEIDQYHLKVNSVVIGAGIPLVACRVTSTGLTLRSSRALRGGTLLDVYRVLQKVGA